MSVFPFRDALLIGTVALSACTSAPLAPTPAVATAAPAAAAGKTAADERDVITGSRIPSRSTDRLVRVTGAAGAKEMDRERGPDPGPLNR